MEMILECVTPSTRRPLKPLTRERSHQRVQWCRVPGFLKLQITRDVSPGSDLGIHLTLTSEWKHYRWRPILGQGCASLVDDSGYFFQDATGTDWNTEEARMELSAQIEEAKRAGVVPTHIDSHMLSVFKKIDLTRAYVELAKIHNIPFLISGSFNGEVEKTVSDADIVVDKVFSLRPGLPEQKWMGYYLRVVKSITPGLNQLIVHLGHDDDELRTITSGHAFWAAGWRQRDFDAVHE